ncbi:hypothetical protein BJ742DRAFT_853225 [Cladochytrium replicatum]|nr:hypothetical protein BJ742DRAFT_853225 [Cladochytrium replicatum]
MLCPGLCESDATFAPSVLRVELSIPNSNENLGGPTARREFHVQGQQRQMDQKLKELKLLSRPDDKHLKYCQRIEKPPPRRPHTPKGFRRGKERRLQLIGELRTRQTILRVAEQHAFDAAAAGAAPAATKAAKLDASKEDKGPFGKEEEEGVLSISGTADGVADPARSETPVGRILAKLDAEEEEEQMGSEQWTETETLTENQQIERLFEANVESKYVGKTLDFLTKEIVLLR